MRLHATFAVSISSTSAEEKDHGNLARDIIEDAYLEGGSTRLRLAASASNIAATLPGVAAASFLCIRTHAVDPTQTPSSITVRLNDPGADPITIAPIGNTKEGFLLLSTSGVTAIYLTNPSGTVPMFVTVMCVGDA